ncbi:MAG: hypothetical protein A3H29_02540 [Acidobacteria bacterium RIFCSPLOWO2_02_FULL_67_21]|nr:MAG: hypothetical protein A3H29_02540 [Acidobacteria bacterium RIFCSPLOWO2_02_FULL_67_21]
MTAVYGLYPDGASAQQAVNRLRAAGVLDRDITVISAQPMEDYEFGQMDKATWMWWFACLGGLIGLSAGLGLTWLTETSWPMDVGGLPIYAWWPNTIIIFEMTMLGAIVATTLTFVLSALWPQRGRTLYDPEVTEGQILVGVEHPVDELVSELERALSAPPGARVKTR